MKYRLILLCMLMSVMTPAEAVRFKFSGSKPNVTSSVSSVEENVAALLTEITRAGQSGDTVLNLSGIRMEEGAKQRLCALWEDIHFVCEDNVVVSLCLNDHQGYQMRDIKVLFKPLDDTYVGDLNRLLVVSINRAGVITGVRPAMEKHSVANQIVEKGIDVDDMTMRREILKWVEDFRCYYNEKNIDALDKIYSDDALIITGSVVSPKKLGSDGPRLNSEVKYTVQDKKQYIEKLKGVFSRNKHLNVQFDKITVERHGSKGHIYGVTLKQTWKSSNYSDEGWLFLVWDFSNPDAPQIDVRTWQDNQAVLLEGGVFGLPDFFIN